MGTVKPYLTYKEQLDKLRNRGCKISNDSSCEERIQHIGYYRLSAYFLPFKNEDGNYEGDVTFDKIINIYEFDRKLRNLLLEAIEVIEVSFRARLAYFHAGKYGPLGYLDPDSFNDKHDSVKFNENIEREIKKNKNIPFVAHV